MLGVLPDHDLSGAAARGRRGGAAVTDPAGDDFDPQVGDDFDPQVEAAYAEPSMLVGRLGDDDHPRVVPGLPQPGVDRGVAGSLIRTRDTIRGDRRAEIGPPLAGSADGRPGAPRRQRGRPRLARHGRAGGWSALAFFPVLLVVVAARRGHRNQGFPGSP